MQTRLYVGLYAFLSVHKSRKRRQMFPLFNRVTRNLISWAQIFHLMLRHTHIAAVKLPPFPERLAKVSEGDQIKEESSAVQQIKQNSLRSRLPTRHPCFYPFNFTSLSLTKEEDRSRQVPTAVNV